MFLQLYATCIWFGPSQNLMHKSKRRIIGMLWSISQTKNRSTCTKQINLSCYTRKAKNVLPLGTYTPLIFLLSFFIIERMDASFCAHLECSTIQGH